MELLAPSTNQQKKSIDLRIALVKTIITARRSFCIAIASSFALNSLTKHWTWTLIKKREKKWLQCRFCFCRILWFTEWRLMLSKSSFASSLQLTLLLMNLRPSTTLKVVEINKASAIIWCFFHADSPSISSKHWSRFNCQTHNLLSIQIVHGSCKRWQTVGCEETELTTVAFESRLEAL